MNRWPPKPACISWSPTRATGTCTCPRPVCGCTSSFCLMFWRKAPGGRSRWRFTRRNRDSGASGTWWRSAWISNAADGTLFRWRMPCKWFSPKVIAGRTWTYGAKCAIRWVSCLFWWTQPMNPTIHSLWSKREQLTTNTVSANEALNATAAVVCVAANSFTSISASSAGTIGSSPRQGTLGIIAKGIVRRTCPEFPDRLRLSTQPSWTNTACEEWVQDPWTPAASRPNSAPCPCCTLMTNTTSWNGMCPTWSSRSVAALETFKVS